MSHEYFYLPKFLIRHFLAVYSLKKALPVSKISYNSADYSSKIPLPESLKPRKQAGSKSFRQHSTSTQAASYFRSVQASFKQRKSHLYSSLISNHSSHYQSSAALTQITTSPYQQTLKSLPSISNILFDHNLIIHSNSDSQQIR